MIQNHAAHSFEEVFMLIVIMLVIVCIIILGLLSTRKMMPYTSFVNNDRHLIEHKRVCINSPGEMMRLIIGGRNVVCAHMMAVLVAQV